MQNYKFLEIPNMLTLIPLFFSILSAVDGQQCLADVNLPNLIQDSISIVISSAQMIQRFQYPLIIFDEQPDFGMSINKIEWTDIHSLQYSLSKSFTSNSLIITYQEPKFNKDNMIRKIGLTLWISSRKDIIFTTAVFRNINALSHSSEEINLDVKKSGIKLQNTKVFISLMNMNVTTQMQYLDIESDGIVTQRQNGLALIANVSCGHHTTVNQISVSFVILTPSLLDQHSNRFNSLSTQIKFNPFQSTTSFNVILDSQIEIYPLQYALVGLRGLRVTGTSKLSLQFQLVSKNLDFINIISSDSIDRLFLNYLVIGNNMMMACIQCPDSYIYQPIGHQALCVSQNQCPNLPFSNQDKMLFACKDCSDQINMELEIGQNGNSCKCKQGYTLSSTNSCQKIHVSNSLNDQKCSDPLSQRNPQTNKCQCKEGFTQDFFGFCSQECQIANSYWDNELDDCVCFTGFVKQANNCIQIKSQCGANQNLVNGICVCNSNSVSSQAQGVCILCTIGTFKNQSAQICQNCPLKCKQCLSQDLCLNCNEGYFLKDLKCISICGDGFRVLEEQCDDGNRNSGDGCNNQCRVQDDYQCQQQVNQADLCMKIVKKITLNNKTEPASSLLIPQQKKCRLSLRKKPVYLNGGIVLQVSIEPVQKLKQQQINNLFKIDVDNEIARPPSVFVSQYEEDVKLFRIYLHYNNQLPVIDFRVTVNIWFNECQQNKWLRLNSLVLDYEISDALSISRGEDQLL